MAHTVTIDQKTIKLILTRLEELTQEVKSLKAKLMDDEPPYGSDAWWEWSDKKALEDYKAGRYTEVRTKEELQTFLDSLKKP